MSVNVKKIIPKDPKSIIVALIFLSLVGYMACPLSIALEPVDWWTSYDMLWWSDNFTTDRFLTESDVAENVGLLASSSSGSGILGLHAYGTGQMYGKLIYTFTTDWIIEKGRLGVIANSASKTCAVDVFINNQQAGSFNGSKEMLFCTPKYLPSNDDPRQWIVCQDPHKIEIKLIFYTVNANGPKDLILSLMEFSARVHLDPDDEEEEGKGSLVGHVINSQTNAKIPSATIALGNHSTQSDSQGYYEINNVKPGTYTVKVTKSGYKEATNTVTISECETTGCNQFDAYLTPENSVSTSGAGTLEGYITHENAPPIENAQVLLMLQLSTMYEARTDSKGYYKISNIEQRTYSIKILAKNCAPHDNTVDLIGENRYDAKMGDGVSYPILPGRGFTEQDGETNYNYYPPVPPDYPTYVPRIRESAGNNYPLQGPVYQNPTDPAPSDGADYVPPPPGYQNSNVSGSGVSSPPSGGLVGTIERSVRGWQTIFQNIGRLIRRLS